MLPRRSYLDVSIQHAMSTPLPDVGLQVWLGTLVLCDFLLARPALLASAWVLELGGGTGLASIVASRAGASAVFCTDRGAAILANCSQNIASNKAAVHVRELDWQQPATWLEARCACASPACTAWHQPDLPPATQPLVLLAADGVPAATTPRTRLLFCLSLTAPPWVHPPWHVLMDQQCSTTLKSPMPSWRA